MLVDNLVPSSNSFHSLDFFQVNDWPQKDVSSTSGSHRAALADLVGSEELKYHFAESDTSSRFPFSGTLLTRGAESGTSPLLGANVPVE